MILDKSAQNKDLIRITLVGMSFLTYQTFVLIFGILFFYQEFQGNILLAVLPFVIGHFFYAMFVKYSTSIMGKLGTKVTMSLSLMFFSISAIPGIAYHYTGTLSILLMWFTFIYIGKLFYHPSNILVLEHVTTKSKRGSQMGFRNIMFIGTGIIAPLIGGIAAEEMGFIGLVILGVSVIILALIPLSRLTVDYKFKLKTSIFELLKQPYSYKLFNSNAAFLTGKMAGRIWPISLFLIAGGTFLDVGNIIFISSLVSIIIVFFLGKYLDNHKRFKAFELTEIFIALGIALRGLVKTIGGAIFADLYNRTLTQLSIEEIMVINYDITTEKKDNKSYIERLIAREIIINLLISVLLLLASFIAMITNLRSMYLILAAIEILAITIMRLNPKIDD